MSENKSFQRSKRLLQPDEFKLVFASKCYHRGKYLLFYARLNDLPYSRLGLVVGKRQIPHAVNRNFIRRHLREFFRLHQANLPSLDFIIRVNRVVLHADLTQVRQELSRSFELTRQCHKF